MTKAEREVIKTRVRELINEGVDRDLAKVMAKVELECNLIRPVVNYN